MKLKLILLALIFFFSPLVAHGATEFVSIIDPDNGAGTDYTSLAAWEAAIQTDLTAANTQRFNVILTGSAIVDGTTMYLCRAGVYQNNTWRLVHYSTASYALFDNGSGSPQLADRWYTNSTCNSAGYLTFQTGVADSAIAVATVRSTNGTADTTPVTISGWTTSATNYVKVVAYDPNTSVLTLSRKLDRGKWDDTKYKLATPTGAPALTVAQDYAVIDGIQIASTGTAAADSSIKIDSDASYVSIKNNLLKNGYTGISASPNSGKGGHTFYNNIIYNTYASGINISGIGLDSAVYNNTLYNCNTSNTSSQEGIHTLAGTIVTNNISLNNGIGDFSGGTQAYNISSDATATGTGSQTSKTPAQLAFISTTSGSEDFHIQENSIANETGTDLSGTFGDDVDGRGRRGLWDIGADQITSRIFRSVGPGATSALTTGASNPMSISASTATFTTDLADNIGVGDVIQYDSDDNGSIDALAFISGRTDATHYTVKKADGTAPVTTATSDSDWSIFRAYTSLANAEAGIENTGINATYRNFDDWTAGGDATTDDVGRDLVVNNEEWNIACYAGSAPDGTVTITGWLTNIYQNTLKIYTPYASNEVGIRQRHIGKWDNTKYMISVALGNALYATTIGSGLIIDGLQISNTGTLTTAYGILVYSRFIYPITIGNCIVKGGYYGISSPSSAGHGTSGLAIYNNTIYNTGRFGIYVMGAPTELKLIYNNTVYNYNSMGLASANGIYTSATANPNLTYVKNNIVFNATHSATVVDYKFLTYPVNQSYNISSDATATGTGSKPSTTVLFTDPANGDFHLDPANTSAINAGVDLSADPDGFSFNTDFEGDPRPAGKWDIGADEFVGVLQEKARLRGNVLLRGNVKIR